MTQRMPRNEPLHERRHKRKAGAHGPAKRPEVSDEDTRCSLPARHAGDRFVRCFLDKNHEGVCDAFYRREER